MTTNAFDRQSAIETILYLSRRSKEPTFHRISKLLYFADRIHLARYGRLICGDSYTAMKHGPVPSGVYDILKFVKGTGNATFPEAIGAFEVRNGYHVKPLRAENVEWLSDSDIECLNQSLREFDEKGFDELTHISHLTKAWLQADLNEFISLPLLADDVDETFELDGLLVEYISDPIP